MEIAAAWGHEEHPHTRWRVVTVPAPLRNDHKVSRAERARDLTAGLSNLELALTGEDVQQLVALRMQFPRRPSDEGCDAAHATMEVEVSDRARWFLRRMRQVNRFMALTAFGLRSWMITTPPLTAK